MGALEAEGRSAEEARAHEHVLLSDRVETLFSLGRHYLFLPFAALCIVAVLLLENAALPFVTAPLIFELVATVVCNRLKALYEESHGKANPALWARRFTIVSGLVGAMWGVGALVWYVPGSFPAEANLILAFLGLSAVAFVARGAYRPAYLAHAIGSLGPLTAMLLLDGGVYQILSGVLLVCFAGVLASYSEALGKLLDEWTMLRSDNADLIVKLSREKALAESGRDAAQASERTKSAFISNISHELRTPLNAILGMAQLLERSDLEKAQRDHVKVLLESGRGLKMLLDDIIALASQPEEALEAPSEGCDAGQAARVVGRLMQPNAWEKRLRLSVNVASGLPRVAADPRLVRRALLKLVGNAIKFTDRGNIEIALDTMPNDSGRKMVRFSVTDTGPGIPGNLAGALFEPFAKADESYAKRHSGAGVGLAVVKRLIESVGGSIGVDSEPGMGATFWITIPAMQTAQAADRYETEEANPPRGLSLLVHLPDAAARAMVERLLVPFGNRVALAGTLTQAVTMSGRNGFAAVIAAAPAVDVIAAAPGQQTPILAICGREDRPPLGANGVLRWPAAPHALYAAIASLTGEQDAKPDPAGEKGAETTIDAKQIAELEKSLGLKTLIDIMQSFLATANELSQALEDATKREDWNQAGRLAQDFAGAAGELGLTTLASAARILVQGSREGAKVDALATAAGNVIAEHKRVREALQKLYPELSA
jgi:signal transduction histidine kinase